MQGDAPLPLDDPTLAELVAELDAASARLGLALSMEADAYDTFVETRRLVAVAIERWEQAQRRYETLRANARPS